MDHSKELDLYFSELYWSSFLDSVQKTRYRNKTARHFCTFSHGKRISARKSAFDHKALASIRTAIFSPSRAQRHLRQPTRPTTEPHEFPCARPCTKMTKRPTSQHSGPRRRRRYTRYLRCGPHSMAGSPRPWDRRASSPGAAPSTTGQRCLPPRTPG